MVQVKDLTELTVGELWREVKEKEDWWGDLKQETLRVVKRVWEGKPEFKQLFREAHLGIALFDAGRSLKEIEPRVVALIEKLKPRE